MDVNGFALMMAIHGMAFGERYHSIPGIEVQGDVLSSFSKFGDRPASCAQTPLCNAIMFCENDNGGIYYFLHVEPFPDLTIKSSCDAYLFGMYGINSAPKVTLALYLYR